MSTATGRRSRGLVPIQIWVPAQLAQNLDAHLYAQITGLPGAKTSRQMFLTDLIRRALSDAENPALAAHRGRLADAEAPRLEEASS